MLNVDKRLKESFTEDTLFYLFKNTYLFYIIHLKLYTIFLLEYLLIFISEYHFWIYKVNALEEITSPVKITSKHLSSDEKTFHANHT